MNILVVKAFTKEEALAEAEKRGMPAYKNLTSYWRSKGCPEVGFDINRMIVDYLEKNDLSFAEGSVYVKIETGDKKEIPGTVELKDVKDIPTEEDLIPVFEIRNEEGILFGRASSIKDAEKLVKQLCKEYKETLYIRYCQTTAEYNGSIIKKCDYIPAEQKKSTFMFWGNYKNKIECEV